MQHQSRCWAAAGVGKGSDQKPRSKATYPKLPLPRLKKKKIRVPGKKTGLPGAAKLLSERAGTRASLVFRHGASTYFSAPDFPTASPHLGQCRPLAVLLNAEKASIPHVHMAMLSQEAHNKFFFSGNALLPSLQNNVFIIAKPFPS